MKHEREIRCDLCEKRVYGWPWRIDRHDFLIAAEAIRKHMQEDHGYARDTLAAERMAELERSVGFGWNPSQAAHDATERGSYYARDTLAGSTDE